MEYLSVRKSTYNYASNTFFNIHCLPKKGMFAQKKTIIDFNAALCQGVCCFSWLSLVCEYIATSLFVTELLSQ